MASSRPDRGYHQDYIARIRYSNALPAPPNPPKLLNIPGTGLSNETYTSASFASRLVREQPLNIEVDGELGMPIDLIGIPGVFNGDETALFGLDDPPAPHPRDKPLLRPVSTLGKTATATSGVSFLRRTEYISSDQTKSKLEPTAAQDLARLRQNQRKRKRSEVEADHNDPVRMLRDIYKGFDTAYPDDAYRGADSEKNLRGSEVTREDKDAWNNPRHPTKPDLKPLDTYPLLPDLEGFPDTGNYFVMKFMTNPLAATESYDSRVDVSLLRPLEPSLQVQAQRESQQKAHELDPSQPAPGSVPFDYYFFVPEHEEATHNLKRSLDVNDADRNDPSLRSEESGETGQRFFRYQRIRTYETHQQSGDSAEPYGDSVALALHDEKEGTESKVRLRKGAYFYPIVQRISIRPRRAPNAALSNVTAPSQKIDFVDFDVRDPNEEEIVLRESHKTRFESAAHAQAA